MSGEIQGKIRWIVCAPKTYTLGWGLENKLKYINNSIRFFKAIPYFIDDIVTLESVVFVKHVLLFNWKYKLAKMLNIS